MTHFADSDRNNLEIRAEAMDLDMSRRDSNSCNGNMGCIINQQHHGGRGWG